MNHDVMPFFSELLSLRFFFHLMMQTITGAMSTLNPPIPLERPENQARVDYIQDYASGNYYMNIKCCQQNRFFIPMFVVAFRQDLSLIIHRSFMSTQKNFGKIVVFNKPLIDRMNIN